jgi:hypothetical protein
VALKLAALNDFNVKTADIENAYLTAPITEKVWTVLGPEFGDDAVVNTSGKAGAKIPQLPLGDDSSPWGR